MRPYRIALTNSNATSLKCFHPAQAEQLNQCLSRFSSKSACRLVLPSNWVFCGKLTDQGSFFICATEGNPKSVGPCCSFRRELSCDVFLRIHSGSRVSDTKAVSGSIQRLRCSAHTSEKSTADLYANLNSCLCGWISQLLCPSTLQPSRKCRADQSERLQVDSTFQNSSSDSLLSLDHDCRKIGSTLRSFSADAIEQTGTQGVDSSCLQAAILTSIFSAETTVADLVSSPIALPCASLSLEWISSMVRPTQTQSWHPLVTAFQNASYTSNLGLDMFSQTSDLPSSLAKQECGGVLDVPASAVKPKAELCAKNAHCVTPDELGSPEGLALWLGDRLPYGTSQLNLWGTAPGTKRVSNLWIELVEGEISLEDANPPIRTVHVASVKIKNDSGQTLVEAYQEMADGSIRLRNRPLSEKMRPGEYVEDACFRGIFEELGCQLGAKQRVTIQPDSYRRQEEERESLSYPGVLTQYIIHSMDATVEDLPKMEFFTVENEMNCGSVVNSVYTGLSVGRGITGPTSSVAVGVKRHFWRWVSQVS